MSEVILFNRVLTTSESQQVEGYLAWKWGLQKSLPANHPYLYSPYIPSPVTTAFTPLSVGNVALWLDALDPSTITISSGTNVNGWNDKSGNGNNATQTTAARRPAYVNGGVVFTASSTHFMDINVPFSTSHSVFLVSQSLTGTDNYYYGRVGGGAAPTIIQHYSGSRRIEYFDGSDRATLAESPPSSSPSMVNFVRSFGNTVTGFYNGNSAFSIPQTWTADTVNPWAYIGRSDSGNYLNATIFEFIIFRTALTDANRQKIEGYLAWKWNLVGSLPTNHPYFSTKP